MRIPTPRSTSRCAAAGACYLSPVIRAIASTKQAILSRSAAPRPRARADAEVEKIVGRLSLEPTVSAARWQAEGHLDSDGGATAVTMNHPQPLNGTGAAK
jgi:hypothetical protein